jgi:hypothetical protein
VDNRQKSKEEVSTVTSFGSPFACENASDDQSCGRCRISGDGGTKRNGQAEEEVVSKVYTKT